MIDSHDFLLNLAMVFSVAAVVTLVFQRLRMPVVLGYLLAGMVVGPHVQVIPLFADVAVVNSLSELGVILLLFGIGLELNLRRLLAVAPTGGLIALGEVSFTAWLGFQAATLLGWTTSEALFTGAIVGISSTSIIALAFEERKVGGVWRDVTYGILIVEDLLAILVLVALGLVAGGRSVEPAALGAELLTLVLSLTAILAVDLVVVPRLFRDIVAHGRPETVVVASMGLCFGQALLMQHLGYSVALGAFLAGTMIAESGHGHEVLEAVRPLRDAFAALFFVSVGMLLDPALVLVYAPAILVLSVVVVSGKLLGVTLGSFLVGNGLRASVQVGMTMTQIGEMSFVIATLGTASGAVGEFLYPVAVSVSVITTFTTPYAIRAADPLARWVDHKLPERLALWTSLYTGQITWLRGNAALSRGAGGDGRLLAGLVVDVLLLGALAAVYGVYGRAAVGSLAHAVGLDHGLAWLTVATCAAVLAAPLLWGIVRLSGALADRLTGPLTERLEGEAPGTSRALSAGVRVAVSTLAGLVVLALTMPWLPAGPAVLALAGIEVLLVALLWRSMGDMRHDLVPGATVIARAILRGTDSARAEQERPSLPCHVAIGDAHHAVGRSLVELDVRARTGASVVAVQEPGEEARYPRGREPLMVGMRLTLVGPDEALAAAERLLRAGG